MKAERTNWTRGDYMRRYPRVTAHIICESLGYACPSTAAGILCCADQGKQYLCEWISACYAGDTRAPVARAVKYRHHHRGYMAHYPHALALVKVAVTQGREPVLASWF